MNTEIVSPNASIPMSATLPPADRHNQPTANQGRLRVTMTWVWLAVIAVSLLFIVRALPAQEALRLLQDTVADLGMWGPVVFGLAYLAAGLLFVPGAALTLAAGAIFGLLAGTIIVSAASTLTAAVAFLIARYAARRRVAELAGRRPRFAAIDEAIGAGGWRIVALLRLSPAVPFSLGNYLYGLTAIRFWPYVLASWAFMLPGTFLYVYIGHLGAAGIAAAGASPAVQTGRLALLVTGLAATVVVTAYVTRLARRALAQHTAVIRSDGGERRSPRATPARRLRLLPLVAILLAAGAVLARAQRSRLQSLLGPPAIKLAEAYPERPDGPIFDHHPFDALLRKHVSAGGWVDYDGLTKDAASLDAYLVSLKTAPWDELGRDERLALLINAYNAFTLKLILEHWDGGKLKSIKDIPAKQRWEAVRWDVGGHTWSLNQIEQEQIRPKFREPRVHFALVCAAAGCPPLRAEAYTGRRLEQQLDEQARYVHQHSRWFRYAAGSGQVELTRLYSWYRGDFEQVAGSVLAFAARYAPPLRAALDAGKHPRIRWLKYDWRLNRKEHAP